MFYTLHNVQIESAPTVWRRVVPVPPLSVARPLVRPVSRPTHGRVDPSLSTRPVSLARNPLPPPNVRTETFRPLDRTGWDTP